MNRQAARDKPLALVVSDSNIDQDSRVRNQVRWLVTAGWQVDTLGIGVSPTDTNGRHYSLGRRNFASRMLGYMFLSNGSRFRYLLESQIPEELQKASGRYDLIIFNEVDLLPWADSHGQHLLRKVAHAKIHLDLHEYALSHGVGLAWRILFARYRRWLASFIQSKVFKTRSVVAQAIGNLYVDDYAIEQPIVIMSCPEFVDQRPSKVDPHSIRIIHHGKADLDRGLDLLINACEFLDARYSITFMLNGSIDALNDLKKFSEPYANRVIFIDPVPVAEVATRINEFDLEVIYFPPVTENLRFALPNKFFEAVQGRLAIVTGESPSMTALSTKYQLGPIVSGWDSQSLANTLNALTNEDIEAFKQSAHMAAQAFNSVLIGEIFLESVVPKFGDYS